MKKYISLLFAIVMTLSLTTNAFAHSATQKPETASLNGVEIGEPVAAVAIKRGPSTTYALDIPADGKFHEITEFYGEYTDGSRIQVSGTWSPTFVGLTFEFEDDMSGAGVGSFLSKSGSSRSVTLTADSLWKLYIMVDADEVDISGRLQVTFI